MIAVDSWLALYRIGLVNPGRYTFVGFYRGRQQTVAIVMVFCRWFEVPISAMMPPHQAGWPTIMQGVGQVNYVP